MANVYGLIFEVEDKTKKGVRSIDTGLKRLEKSANSVKKAMGGIGRLASGVGGALGKTALAATAAAGAFGFLAKKNLDALDALGKTASKLGVTTQFLSSYGFVANQAGLSTDQFETGLQRFIRRLGQAQQGTGELVKPLKQLGIDMLDANGNFREGTDVFEEFLGKLGSTTNNAQRLALAMGAFDTEGVAFINIAKMGSTEISNLRREAELAGIVISDKLAKGAEDANDAIGQLIARGRGFGLQFFGALAPGIETIADDLKKALDGVIADAGGMEVFSRRLAGEFLNGAADFVSALATLFDGFTNGLAVGTNALKNILTSLPSALTGGINYEMGSAEGLGERRDALIADIRSIADEVGIEYEKMFNRFGGAGSLEAAAKSIMHPFLMTEAEMINRELMDVEETLASVADGSVIFLNSVATNSTRASDAVAGTIEKLREMGTALETNTEIQKSAEDIAAETIRLIAEETAANEALLAARYAAANGLVESLAPQETALESLQKHLNKVKSAQDLLIEGFVNGANRMGTGTQATLAFEQGLIRLKAELDKTTEAMALLQRQQEYLEQPELKLIDRHTQLKKELGDVQLQMIRVRTEMALAAGDTEAYAFALASLIEEEKRLKAALTPGATTSTAPTSTPVNPITSFDDYYKGLADSATNAANEIGYAERAQKRLKQALDQGKISAEAFDIAMQRTNETLGQSNPYIDNIENALLNLSGSIASNMTDVIFGLKDGFAALEDIALSVLQTIIQTLIETFIRQQMIAAFGGGAGGGGGIGSLLGLGAAAIPGLGLLVGAGALLGGLFADGGNTAKAGQKPIVVGEKGPEIFMPGKAGTVVPNDELNSVGGQGDTNVSFTINAIDTQTGVQFLLENKRVITGVIQEAYQRRGSTGPLG
jgi:hypothetical protein